jgi:predicted NUDIX family phosphoesterase
MRWPNERVLVVRRRLFDDLGAFEGFSPKVDHYLPRFLDPTQNFFLSRDDAEEDPSHKQIIPYAIFHCQGRFLHYVRGSKGGEKRLAAKGSIGIGGHINSDDAAQASVEKDTYLTGVEREMNEELLLRTKYTQRIVALINDDSNEVGKVHIGVVHVFELETEDVDANEAPITELTFVSRADLIARRDTLESWSQICVDHLDLICPVSSPEAI